MSFAPRPSGPATAKNLGTVVGAWPAPEEMAQPLALFRHSAEFPSQTMLALRSDTLCLRVEILPQQGELMLRLSRRPDLDLAAFTRLGVVAGADAKARIVAAVEAAGDYHERANHCGAITDRVVAALLD